MLLKKGIYPYQFMNSWKRFYEAMLLSKKALYSELSSEDITNEDYIHAQKVIEELKVKYRGEYHDLYVQSDILLLADVFENFKNKCTDKYEYDSALFVFARGLAWRPCLKNTRLKLALLTDIDMLLMFEKGIRGRIFNAIHKYAEAKISIWKIMIKTLNHHTSYV